MNDKLREFAKSLLRERIMYTILVAIIIFFSVFAKNFATWSNIRNIINQSSYLITLGVGMILIMLCGALDLSIGYQISINAVQIGKMLAAGVPVPVVILCGLLFGVITSGINGAIYVALDVFPFIITLATQYVYMGASYLISGSRSTGNFPAAFKFIGQGSLGPIPFAIVIMVVCVALGSYVLNRTYFGRYVYALGSNPDAVKLSGVNVGRMKFVIFIIAGFFIGLGSIMLVSRTGSAGSTIGPGVEFTVMCGGLLGGIKMGGAQTGKMSSIIVGLMIIQVLSNGMQLMQMNVYKQYVAQGIVLLLALALDTFQSRAAIARAKRVAGAAPRPGGA